MECSPFRALVSTNDNASGISKLFKIAHRRPDRAPLTRALKFLPDNEAPASCILSSILESSCLEINAFRARQVAHAGPPDESRSEAFLRSSANRVGKKPRLGHGGSTLSQRRISLALVASLSISSADHDLCKLKGVPAWRTSNIGLMGLLRQLEPLLCELEQTFLVTRLQRMFGQLDAIISIFPIGVSRRGHHRSPFALTERARLRAVARVSGEFGRGKRAPQAQMATIAIVTTANPMLTIRTYGT